MFGGLWKPYNWEDDEVEESTVDPTSEFWRIIWLSWPDDDERQELRDEFNDGIEFA